MSFYRISQFVNNYNFISLLHAEILRQINSEAIKNPADTVTSKDTTAVNLLYGIPVDSFDQVTGRIKPNSFLSDILLKHGVSMTEMDQVLKNSGTVFDVRSVRSGNKLYSLL